MKRHFVVVPYLAVVVAIGLATVVTLSWTPLRQLHNLSAYFVVIVLTAFFAGWLPSLLAICLSAFSFAYFIAPPAGLSIGDPKDQFRLGMFMGLALLVCFLQAARAKAELKARLLAQRLSLALEATKLGVWDLNLRSGTIWHSQSLEEVYGRDSDRFAKAYEVFLGYVHPDDRDFVHRTVTHTIETGQEFHIQHRVVSPKGHVRCVSTRARVFLDDKSQPERLVAVTADMTDRAGVVLPPRAPAPTPAPTPAIVSYSPAPQIIPASAAPAH